MTASQEPASSAAPPRLPPPPYRVYPDFLRPAEHAALLAWALDNQARFTPALLKGRLLDPKVRLALSLRDLGPSDPILRERLLERLAALVQDLGITPFAPHRIELELAAHNHGAHFAAHVDTFTGEARAKTGDRIISGVYYFYRKPRSFSGGQLRLHRFGEENEGFVDIEPAQNSFVAFPSWAMHEVRPVCCPSQDFADSRFAVNCWFYRARTAQAGQSPKGGSIT